METDNEESQLVEKKGKRVKGEFKGIVFFTRSKKNTAVDVRCFLFKR